MYSIFPIYVEKQQFTKCKHTLKVAISISAIWKKNNIDKIELLQVGESVRNIIWKKNFNKKKRHFKKR